MMRTRIEFCHTCANYTKHICIGKVPLSQEEKSFDRFATILTLGAYQISKCLYGEHPKIWECKNCGNTIKK